MATIEIRAKDITGLDFPHHLYIVYNVPCEYKM